MCIRDRRSGLAVIRGVVMIIFKFQDVYKRQVTSLYIATGALKYKNTTNIFTNLKKQIKLKISKNKKI